MLMLTTAFAAWTAPGALLRGHARCNEARARAVVLSVEMAQSAGLQATLLAATSAACFWQARDLMPLQLSLPRRRGLESELDGLMEELERRGSLKTRFEEPPRVRRPAISSELHVPAPSPDVSPLSELRAALEVAVRDEAYYDAAWMSAECLYRSEYD